MSIILASGSPRRRELMEMLGAPGLIVRPAESDENPPSGAGPEETVRALSLEKALAVARTAGDGDVVVAADTLVALDGALLGKPRDAAEARRMLRALSGREHQVFTGVTAVRDGKILTEAEMTRVRFRPLEEGEIAAYVATEEPLDKAGAYGAQGLGSLFVEGIAGDFFNVMGLPLCRLGIMLKKLGVELL